METDGRFHVAKIVPGSSIQDMVAFARYDTSALQDLFAKRLSGLVDAGKTNAHEAEKLVNQYKSAAKWSTYLD